MKKFLAVILLCGLSITLSACSKTSNEDPQTVVNRFLQEIAGKTVDYKAGKIVFTGKGSLDAAGNSAALEGTTDVSFDSTDTNNSKSAIKLDLKGNGTLEGKSAKVGLKGELRTVNKKLYVYLEDLSVDSEDPSTSMMAGLFGGFLKGKWNEIPGAIEDSEANPLDSQNLSADQMKVIATNNPFLTVVKDLGDRTFEVKIDIVKLKAYISEMAKVAQTPVTQEDLDAIDKIFASLGEYSIVLQIDEEYDLEHLKASLMVDDPAQNQKLTVNIDADFDEDSTEGSFDISVSGEEPTKLHLEGRAEHKKSSRESIEAPADAKVFDMNEIMGGLGGGLSTGSGAAGMTGLEGVPAPEGVDLPAY